MVRRVLQLDEAALWGMRRWHSPTLTRVMRGLTRLGDAESVMLVTLALLSAGGTAAERARLIAVAASLATLLAQALKRTCRRRRPSVGILGFTALADDPDAFSFPSGHTAAVVAVAIAMVGQGVFAPVCLALAAGIGVSRVYLGAHYPLDVAAGGVLGALGGLLARVWVG
jgi:undecaprenyl-diphosphatase